MIRQSIYIKRYNWRVAAYYDVRCADAREIAERLSVAGAAHDFVVQARDNLCSGLDHGICYSDMAGCSVLVVGQASSDAELVNSLVHELHHLVCHICEGRRIDVFGEEAAYLVGDLAGMVWPILRRTVCCG